MPISNHQSLLSDRGRSLRASSTLAVDARVNEMKRQGIDVVGFGAGQPDFDTPDNIKQAAIGALLAGKTKYVATAGAPEARTAIATKLRADNRITCEPEHIVITTGAKLALYMTMQMVVNPGQEVLLPAPCWVSYRPMAELAGGQVVELPGAIDNDFKITPTQLAASITPNTAAIIINSPSNPCGTMYSEEELRGLAEVLIDHQQIAIVMDEIYEKIIFGGVPHFSMGSIPELADRVITINGLSKAYAMTGWRIGYLCAPGNDGEIARTVPRLQDQMTSSITSFCYPAIVEALEHGAQSVESMRQAFARRADVMFDAVRSIPGFRCPKPTGAFYVFPEVSGLLGRTSPGGVLLESPLALAEAMLDEAGVAVVPGEDFGVCGRSHIRLSFACSEEQIVAGTERIREWVGRLS